MLTLFRPETGQVRAHPVDQSTNAILHPWLKEELTQILAQLPVLDAPVADTQGRHFRDWSAGAEATAETDRPLVRLIVVLDNLTGHYTPVFVAWCILNGILLLYTPLGGSWLNMAESVQRILVRRALSGQHPKSADEIKEWLSATVSGWNADPTPFCWAGNAGRVVSVFGNGIRWVARVVTLLGPSVDVGRQTILLSAMAGRVTSDPLALALEGRRRVKEQLKKLGSFEYHQTSFSYIDQETLMEHYVGVPEEGGRNLISTDPLAPGSVYTASVDDQGKTALYRLEIGCASGTGRLRMSGSIDSTMRESIHRAFAYVQGHKANMGIAQTLDTTDFHLEAIDLLTNQISCEIGVGFVVALYSAIKKQATSAGLVILGDLSIQGNIKPARSLAEPMQIAMDNGARRALIPIENKRHLLEVSADVMERVDAIFFGDPITAATKALGL